MSLMAKEQAKERVLIPEGMYDAVCWMVVDLGTTLNTTFNKSQHKVLIGWEIPAERIVLERDGKDVSLPKVMSKKYSLSLHQKANLRKELEGWRGQRFTADELAGFDIQRLLGVPATIQVMHSEGRDGKTYANIENILPATDGAKGLKTENPVLSFSFEDGCSIPPELPGWVQDLIKEADEYKAMAGHDEPVEVDELPPASDDDMPWAGEEPAPF